MADEKKVLPGEKKPLPAEKPVKKKKKNRVAKWFREMRSELKKVVWSTPKQVVNNTVVALVIMLASAVVIWGFDTLADRAIQILTSLRG